MRHAQRFLLFFGFSVLCALPTSAFADANTSESPPISAERIRIAFAERGYLVEHSVTSDWTSPPFASVRVRDAAADRVVLILAYPDVAALGMVARHPSTSIAPGFGPAVFRRNLAIVQSNASELRRLAQYDLDCDVGVAIGQSPDPAPIPLPISVDSDFLAILANLE